MSTLYITTPIYYVNDVPHLGHAYTTFLADAFARYHRSAHHAPGDHTRMLTGTDEHGQKIEEAATKRGLTPQALTDEVAPRFRDAWATLGIAHDDFIRTTEPRHKAVVAALWQRLYDRGDLYLAAYEGWYCVGCEAFYTESQLEKRDDAWHCTTHKRPVTWVAKERSWFFRMSAYQQALIDHIEAHPEFITPEGYRNEVLSFVRSGLRDLSVSRTSFAWGITPSTPDPDGLAHVIYVWLDALTNYYSALCEPGTLSGPRVDTFWPAATHLIGKDILRFHAVYWPCFLLAAGLPLPQRIVTHGWWTVRGEKISKSLPATRIDPVALATALGARAPLGTAIGIDALRYYLLREAPLGNDGDFTFESLHARYNAELANDLGNFVNRSLTLIQKFGAAYPPAFSARLAAQGAHASLAAVTDAVCQDATTQLEAFAPSRALEAIWRLVREANRYVDATQPWTLAKQAPTNAEAAEALAFTLHTMRGLLLVIAELVRPIMPTCGATLAKWAGAPTTAHGEWPRNHQALWHYEAGPWATDNQPLFPRLDDDAAAAIVAAVLPQLNEAMTQAPVSQPPTSPTPPAAPSSAAPSSNALISYDDFMKTELRLGKVVAAEPIAKAKKLLKLQVDLGEGSPRQIVAGLALAYTPEALVGQHVIVVANLAPAEIRGVTSHGMLLAVGDDAIVGLASVAPTADTSLASMPLGARVR